MTRCIYPECNEKATLGCTCHLEWWCDEHIDNHYKAMKIGLKKS